MSNTKVTRVRGRTLKLTGPMYVIKELLETLSKTAYSVFNFEPEHDSVDNLKEHLRPAYRLIAGIINDLPENLKFDLIKEEVKPEHLYGLTYECIVIAGYISIGVTVQRDKVVSSLTLEMSPDGKPPVMIGLLRNNKTDPNNPVLL